MSKKSKKKKAQGSQTLGLRLLKKGRRGVIKMIFSRTGIILLLLLINIAILIIPFIWFKEFLPQVYSVATVFTVAMVLYIINNRMDPTSKITWLIIIMLLPVLGSVLYLYTKMEIGHRAMRKKLQKIYAASPCGEMSDCGDSLRRLSPGAAAMTGYVSSLTGFPLCRNTMCEYFSSGEEMLPRMLSELEGAERSVYLEYFIIEEGVMWGQILEILARKAKEGVDVRVIYDGTCELLLLPKGYPKKLKSLGIKCHVFSPATPFVSTHYNYRDHRKIMSIDGRVAFTGGINLADEYINEKVVHGHWKDSGIMLRGEGALSFERMFLQIWNLMERNISFPQVADSREEIPRDCAEGGYVMPYYEDPLDNEHIAKQVYVDILSRAEKYVYIMTPYLILDGVLDSALTYAAKRGVEVVILLPGIPDKRVPFALAKSHYSQLLKAGVKIYEYTPGFLHSKSVVADGREAVVGSINFDYRSLYHHFECAVYLYNDPCIEKITEDFNKTLESSSEVSEKTVKSEKLFYKITGCIMKIIAPLL